MLTRLVFILLVALGGAGLAIQMACNARLRMATGSAILTTILSVLVTLISLALVWISGLADRGSIPAFHSLPKWAWFGGIATFEETKPRCIFCDAYAYALHRIGTRSSQMLFCMRKRDSAG